MSQRGAWAGAFANYGLKFQASKRNNRKISYHVLSLTERSLNLVPGTTFLDRNFEKKKQPRV